MSRKRILIVSRAFYPQNSPRSFRTTELAKELSKQGHEVVVVTPKQAVHPDFERQHNITIKDMGSPDEVLAKATAKPGLVGKFVHRFKEQFLLYPQFKLKDIVYKALKGEENKNYDVLISIAAPHPVHWGVSKALRSYKNITKKWIADCGDPFMFAHNLQYNRPFYFRFYEKDFCKRADFITIPTESAKDGYYPEFRNKLKVIPQGFNFEEVKLSPNSSSGDILEFGYAGSLIKGRRDPIELLRYLKEKNVKFRFVIYSKNKPFVDTLVKEFPEEIAYMGEASRLDLLYHLSELDFVLNFENIGSNQTPSKLIDYAIIKKPILSVMFGNLDKKLVDQFVSRDYSSQLQINNIDQYKIDNIARNFVALAE